MSLTQKRLPFLFLFALLLLLCGSAYLRLQFDFNAGHMDEYDYLFVGRQLLSGRDWATHIYIFGADLSWYLLGWGEKYLGGLSGARTVAGVLGVASLVGVYAFVITLWRNHLTAVIAVSLLASQSIHLFLSRFATYDIVSFTFFCLALAPLVLACQHKSTGRYFYLALSVVLISLSVLSKYVVVLYLPFIGLILLFRSPRIGFLFGLGVGSILIAYAAIHWESLQVLYRVQIQNVHGSSNGSLGYVSKSIISYLWPALVGCVIAVFYSVFRDSLTSLKRKQGVYLCLLAVLSLPLVAYHFNALNMISLYKHLVYANLFLLVASAWLIAQLLQSGDSILKQGFLSVLLAGYAVLNFQQLKLAETAYANVSPVLSAVESRLDARTTILSEDPYLFRYLGFNDVPQGHIKESNWLDNNRDGVYEKKDVVEAIWDAKFSYVYLNDQLHPKMNKSIRKVLKVRGYKAVFEVNYKISEVMTRQKKGALGLYQRTREAKFTLEEDELFSRGKSLREFIKRTEND